VKSPRQDRDLRNNDAMNGFWPGLLLALCLIPAGVLLRLVGIVVGFGLVKLTKKTRLRRAGIAIGEAVNTTTALLAAALPVLGILVGIVLGAYWMIFTDRSGAGLVVGSLISALLLIPYLPLIAFSTDQSPRDTAEPEEARVENRHSSAEPAALQQDSLGGRRVADPPHDAPPAAERPPHRPTATPQPVTRPAAKEAGTERVRPMNAPRTAFLAEPSIESWQPDDPGWCAVVLDWSETAVLRENVRDIVAEKTASAAREAGGFEPTYSLLYRAFDSPAACVFTRPTGQALRAPMTESLRRRHLRVLIEELLADGVELIVTRARSDDPVHHESLVADGTVPASLPWVTAPFRDEPLIDLAPALCWAYRWDRAERGKTDLLRRMEDRVRIIDVDHGTSSTTV